MKRSVRIASLVICVVVLAAGGSWAWRVAPYRDPAVALAAFQDTTRLVGEDQIIDPLILSGARVVPAVLASVRDSGFVHRRYAVRFLGRYDTPAVRERLEQLVQSPTEDRYIRGDALQSLWDIDVNRASSLASNYVRDTTYLGEIANLMLDTPPGYWYEQRSYFDALFGSHH